MTDRTVIDPADKTPHITDLPLRSPIVWAAVALGGGAGAILRFFWGTFFPFTQSVFPWAVFTENITGAFVLGWLLAIFTRQRGKHRYIRAFFGTGLVGSFTTFSGITLDLATYSSPVNMLLLILYPAVSIATGLGLAWAGWVVGCKTRKIRKKNT